MQISLTTLPISYLVTALLALILISSFFSGSETGMMAINRYKLKHISKTNKKAKRVLDLLKRPDRLLAVIVICNNFLNISASAIATLIGARLLGDLGILLSTIILTIILLIFGEITPKTLAAIKPERFTFSTSLLLKWLLFTLYPIVIFTNYISNFILKFFGVKHIQNKNESLSLEELHSVLNDQNSIIPKKHQEMLSSIINLEKMTINDIMIPRTEIVGIDLDDDDEDITNLLKTIQHTVLPVYQNNINKIKGIIHMRDISSLIVKKEFKVNNLYDYIKKPYFVPEGISLYQQLINFQKNKLRLALVVDEYGDIQGLITLADLLEEIVGEFTTNISDFEQNIHPQKNGTILVNGSINIRNLNRSLSLSLPTDKAKTLSGIIIEHLEFIPKPFTCLKIKNYKMEVIHVQENIIKTVKFYDLQQNVEQK